MSLVDPATLVGFTSYAQDQPPSFEQSQDDGSFLGGINLVYISASHSRLTGMKSDQNEGRGNEKEQRRTIDAIVEGGLCTAAKQESGLKEQRGYKPWPTTGTALPGSSKRTPNLQSNHSSSDVPISAGDAFWQDGPRTCNISFILIPCEFKKRVRRK